jgi:hypothetical protein
MMYEELIKRLRSVKDIWQTEEETWMLGAADAIEELSRLHEAQRQNLITLMNEDPEMEWIPVTERFPEFGVKALCKCRANIYDVLTWTAEGWKHDPQHIYMSGFATHWMPLPKRPVEGI